MVKYVKLDVGKSIKGVVVNPLPTLEKGKYGIQHNYTFRINGEDHILQLSEKSPANNSIQMLNAGDAVVIKKVDLGGGKTAWNISLEGDISNLPQNQNLPSGSEAFQNYIDHGEYGQTITPQDVREAFHDPRQVSIEFQSSLRTAAIFLANRTDATSDDVISIGEKFYKALQDKVNKS